jgi:hypothetical protein
VAYERPPDRDTLLKSSRLGSSGSSCKLSGIRLPICHRVRLGLPWPTKEDMYSSGEYGTSPFEI